MFQVVAHYHARDGKADEVAELLKKLAQASRAEEGNISYVIARCLDDDHHFVIAEQYVDAAAFDAHRDSEHFSEIGAEQIIPRLADREVGSYVPA